MQPVICCTEDEEQALMWGQGDLNETPENLESLNQSRIASELYVPQGVQLVLGKGWVNHLQAMAVWWRRWGGGEETNESMGNDWLQLKVTNLCKYTVETELMWWKIYKAWAGIGRGLGVADFGSV